MKTPIHIAAEMGHKDIVQLLLQNGAHLSIRAKDGRTPLHYAAENGHTEIVKMFLEKGAIINWEDEVSKTALHYAANKGHVRIVELLVEKGANLLDQNKSQLSPLQLAAYEGHEAVVTYLLSKGAPIDYTRSGPLNSTAWIRLKELCPKGDLEIYSQRTALHYATANKHENIVKNLILSQANVNVKDKKLMTPFHLAVQEGSEEIATLLCNAQVDVNITDQNGLTAMHFAAESGHVKWAKLLVKKGAKLDEKSLDGMTPLHLACQNSHVAMTEYLLSTGNVNPISETFERKNTPMDLVPPDSKDRTKLLQLFQPFVESQTNFPIETYSKVFLCGYSTAGKSSLGQVIIIRSKKRLNHKFDPQEFVTGVTPFTAGIEPHTVCSPEIGNVILYDFAGHTEYYSSHSAVVEHLMLCSPGVFIVVADLTKPKDVIRKQLFYWFNFIENTCSNISKQSHVLVIGSRADKIANDGWDFVSFIAETAEIGILRQSFKGFVPMECHRPGGKGVVKFISLLDQSCKDVVDRSDGISYYCHVLYSFLKDLQEVAITLSQLCVKITEHIHPSLPTDATVVSDLLSTLSDKGLILYIKGSNWIIVDKTTLLKEIVGVLFAPASIKRVHQKISSNTGIVALSTLMELFPKYDPQMLKGFLTSLEFCQVIDAEFLGVMNASSSTCFDGELLFFPSLIDENFSSGLSSSPTFGWCLWCPKVHSFFTPRFLHVLLLRLALGHCLDASLAGQLDFDDESEDFDRLCKVWINGICWKNYGIEVFVEISEHNRCITVLVSGEGIKSQEICCSVIKEVHDLKNRLCPCESKEYIIAPNQLMQVQEKEVKDRSLIPLEKIAQAMILQSEDMVSDEKGQNAFATETILGTYEPYFSIAPLIIQELFDPKLEQELLPVSRVKCLQLACPSDVMKGIIPPITHQKMRNNFEKYSIFTVHNPLELAMSCMTPHQKEQLTDVLSKSLMATNQERKPTKRELLLLLWDVSSYWQELGNLLGVSSDKLRSLQHSNMSDALKFAEMIEIWLKSKSTCSWNDIIDSLKIEGLGKVAYDVQVSLGLETQQKSAGMTVVAAPKSSPPYLEPEKKGHEVTEAMVNSTPLKDSSEMLPSPLLSPVQLFPTSSETDVKDVSPVHVYSETKKGAEIPKSQKSTNPAGRDDSTSQNLIVMEMSTDPITEQSMKSGDGLSSAFSKPAIIDTMPVLDVHSNNQLPSSSLLPQDQVYQTELPLLETRYAINPSPLPPQETHVQDNLLLDTHLSKNQSHSSLLPQEQDHQTKLDARYSRNLSPLPPQETYVQDHQTKLDTHYSTPLPPQETHVPGHQTKLDIRYSRNMSPLPPQETHVQDHQMKLDTCYSRSLSPLPPQETHVQYHQTKLDTRYSRSPSPLPPQETHVQDHQMKILLDTKNQCPSSLLPPLEKISSPRAHAQDIPSHNYTEGDFDAERSHKNNYSIPDVDNAGNDTLPLQLVKLMGNMLAFHTLLLFTFLNKQNFHATHSVVSDTDLRRCCRYLDKLPMLAGYLGVSDQDLQQIQEKYSYKEIQGYWLLKKWKELNPHATRLELIEILQHLELTEAVESLSS